MDSLSSNTSSNNPTTFIYALIDPETNQMRYIGKSDNPSRRLKAHIRESTRRPTDKHYATHKANWLRSVLQKGKMPILQIIEEVPLEQWKEKECYWIACYQGQGADLTNIAPGGIAHDYSPETIAKAVAKRRGRSHSEDHKRKIGESLKGRPISPRTREVFEKHNRSPRSEATRRKISETQIGRKQSDATKEKIRSANKGRGHPHTEETKSLLREKSRGNKSHFGHKHSIETRAKISKLQEGKDVSHLFTETAKAKNRMVRLANNAKKRGMTLDEYMLVRKERNPKYLSSNNLEGEG